MVRGRGARRPQTLAAVHARHVPEANDARAAARLGALTDTRTDARQGCQVCSNARTLMPEQLSSGLLEEVYRNRSHGLTPMERVPGPPILMARAKKALPWRKRCLPRRSRWARRSQQLFRAPSSGRGSSMLQSRRSARCHSKRWQMPWRGEARACGVMRSKPGGRGHHANVARQMTSSALNRKRIAC